MNFLHWLSPTRSDYQAAVRYGEQIKSWTPSEIPAMQLERLRAVWADATVDVPYYAGLVASGRAPREVRSWDEFHQIPVLDKATFRQHERDFVRLSGPPTRYLQTAGSTGNPVRFGVWGHEGKPLRIAKLVLWVREGYTPGAKVLLVWGHSHMLGTGWRRYVNHVKRKLKDRVLGYIRVNAYTLGPEECERIGRFVVRHRPAGIIGYSAALDLVGRTLAPRRDALRTAGVKFVLATAEMPPRPDSHAMLHDLFNAPVVQEFGGVDFGHLAMKHEDDPWLVFSDLNVLEAAAECDSDGGHPAVVTTLYPRYTPFIRYKQGDSVDGVHRLDNGHIHQFDRLVGRVQDTVTMDDGRSVHSVSLIHCVHQESRVLNIQLLLRDNEMRFRLVVPGGSDPEMEPRIRYRLRQVHPALKNIVMEYVPDLQTNLAGKRRIFVDERTRKPAAG